MGLKVRSLKVSTEQQEILHGVDMEIADGEIVVVVGANGSGKSTLANAIMGTSDLNITDGEITFNNSNITNLPIDKRAEQGIFMAFQNPVEIPGVSIAEMLREQSKNRKDFVKDLYNFADKLKINSSLIQRGGLNVGLSGGEKKKMEILQMLMLSPKLVMLDEIDSGLDTDALKIVLAAMNEFHKNTSATIMIITHNPRTLEFVNADKVYVMENGRVTRSGDVMLAKKVLKDGFLNEGVE